MEKTYNSYSEAFKRKVAREVESGKFSSMHAAAKAYGINGSCTVSRWMSKYANERHIPRKVRIETLEEKNELQEAKKRVRQLEAEVADIYMDYSLERAFLNIACERMDVDRETFKKKHDMTPSEMRKMRGKM